MTFEVLMNRKKDICKYFLSYRMKKQAGVRVYIDMAKINNYHIFGQRYAIFNDFAEYRNISNKIIFNLYVSPYEDPMNILSVLVRVDSHNMEKILSCLSVDTVVKKKDS